MFQRNLVGLCSWLIVATPIVSSASAKESSSGDDWRPLFNGKDLSGWHVVLTPDLKGIDSERVFQVHDGVIHAYQDVPQGAEVPIGFIATDDDYSWYHLKLEYRWVGKRFAPRVERVRDAGLLYHASAEKKVWPRCIECQIQEGDVGDCFIVHGPQLQTTVDPRRLKRDVHHYMSAKDGGIEDVLGGPKIYRVIKSSTHELDDWNTVEVIIRGDKEAIHIVNGHEVFRATDLKQWNSEQETWVPLTSGRILLQAEFAEVQYRSVQIKPVEGGPFRVEAPSDEPKSNK